MFGKRVVALVAAIVVSGPVMAVLEGDATWEATSKAQESDAVWEAESRTALEGDAAWEARIAQLRARAAAGDELARAELRALGLQP
ncbi:hypothetical protein [Shewanella sp. GXUN23E]|uniref:hypothetical protein n=1 Tax=Shewanella sp. GXUN23E TaxID=3422498 RepID=UPI003D7E4899